jgi:hypothetical protein
MLVRSNAVELPVIPFYTARFPTTLAICPSVNCQHSVMLSIVRICSFLQTEHMLCCILSLVTFQLKTDSLSHHLWNVMGQIHATHLLYS